MFAGTDIAARIVCVRRPPLSDPRILQATRCGSSARTWAFCQTLRSLKSLILNNQHAGIGSRERFNARKVFSVPTDSCNLTCPLTTWIPRPSDLPFTQLQCRAKCLQSGEG